MTMTVSASAPVTSEDLIGAFRRFGPRGPLYEVLRLAPTDASAEPMLRIRVVETDEELDYPLAEILLDSEG